MATDPDSCFVHIHHRVSLAGRVRRDNEAPVVGALVELRPRPPRGKSAKVIKRVDDIAAPSRSTVSNADGSFHFIDLPAGDYELAIRHCVVIAGQFVALAERVNVTVAKENETASAKPAMPDFMTIDLKPVA